MKVLAWEGGANPGAAERQVRRGGSRNRSGSGSRSWVGGWGFLWLRVQNTAALGSTEGF